MIPQPSTHARAHPLCCDRWDPYTHPTFRPSLDKAHFDALLDRDQHGKALHCVDSLFHGCLDAPNEIPCGSTMCVDTVGGWRREHYHRLPRLVDAYAAYERAAQGTAVMLRGDPRRSRRMWLRTNRTVLCARSTSTQASQVFHLDAFSLGAYIGPAAGRQGRPGPGIGAPDGLAKALSDIDRATMCLANGQMVYNYSTTGKCPPIFTTDWQREMKIRICTPWCLK